MLHLPEGYVQATYIFQGVGLPRGATMVIGHTDPGTGSATDVAESLMAAWRLDWGGRTDADNGLGEVSVVINRGGELLAGTTTGEPSGDHAAFEPLPPNCSAIVKKVTEFAGRNNRGRMYLPSIHLAEGLVTRDGFIDVTLLGPLQDAASDWLAELQTGSLDPVVLHTEGHPDANTPTLVVNLAVEKQIATQRRRLRG